MKKLISVLAVTLIPLAGLVATSTTAEAAALCSGVQSGDGHTVSIRCTQGSGNQYRIAAEFCGTSTCSVTRSAWRNYGQTASLTSGGFFSGKFSIETRSVVNT
jgi:hypothetical protein